MFEVGDSRAVRGEARGAGPETPCNPPHAGKRGKRLKRSHLLLGALALGLALGALEEAARRAGFAPDMERVAQALGFGIDQVALTGHRFSYDSDIFDALDLGNVRSFGSLDTAAVKSRIERLPWIDTAELTRVFPGRLEIRVAERRPYALWSRADRLYLIDKTGRVLAAVNGETLPDLPRFAGEGAATEAASLLETVALYPEVARRLAMAERVSERRWRLKLDNGTTLELPADNEVGALEGLSRDASLAKLVAAGRTTLDFRGPGRVAIRPDAEADAAASSAAPNPGS
ncbi:MAG: cell division protein FtsQ/DivIB [Hyphomicrobium sp.]|uniref:cell division protein FtsQ/DivIB n=1 Tax=Hyphomicrobium sp. TaxID=82 RepID=UPI003D0D753D